MIPIILYSDFACPFCYIAEQGILPRLREEFSISIEWIGFELHPETPLGGKLLTSIFETQELLGMQDYIMQFAKDFDVSINFPDRIPNTKKALAILEYARQEDKFDLFKENAMQAYWQSGLNLEDDKHLAQIAEQTGLDPKAALEAGQQHSFLEKVAAQREQAQQLGVKKIPAFFIADLPPIIGCQPYQNFRQALLKKQ
jgi:predicted DsbA family dithiol-disulfide isomerase